MNELAVILDLVEDGQARCASSCPHLEREVLVDVAGTDNLSLFVHVRKSLLDINFVMNVKIIAQVKFRDYCVL